MNRTCLRAGMSVVALACASMVGCEWRSYFDPSKTGRFEQTPTTIPILERIDVIQRDEDPWARATGVTPEDLLPNDLTYRLTAGDLITVEAFELLVQGQVTVAQRRIGADGMFRVPVIGDIQAAGLTVQEFQDELTRQINEKVIRNPQINVVVEEGTGFQYTLYGSVAGAGIYSLRRANFHLLDALAVGGGAGLGTKTVFVIRRAPLSEDVIFQPGRDTIPRTTPGAEGGAMDIEQLIQQLEDSGTGAPGPPQTTVPTPPAGQRKPPMEIDELIDRLAGPQPKETREVPEDPPIDIDDLLEGLDDDTAPEVTPGAFAQESGPLIDIDDLEPIGSPPPAPPRTTAPQQTPQAQPPRLEPRPAAPTSGRRRPDSYIYLEDRDEWVPVREVTTSAPGPGFEEETVDVAPELYVERIIKIPYPRLIQGNSAYNIVVRPGDVIYVKEPEVGVVYIDGEIARPGVYSLPANGLTLSRLVAAAGGPSPLAIPERVDLTRIVGENREATVRLNLAAIRMKTEPDLYLRPDDHVLIGTNFWAIPLAVFRSGLRMTYGFGFVLDRNFGNDVFGPPPINIRGGN